MHIHLFLYWLTETETLHINSVMTLLYNRHTPGVVSSFKGLLFLQTVWKAEHMDFIPQDNN